MYLKFRTDFDAGESVGSAGSTGEATVEAGVGNGRVSEGGTI